MQMSTKSITKADCEAYLETLKGLKTLVDMQQTLILQAIGRIDKSAAGGKSKSRSAGRGRTKKRKDK